MQTLSEGSYFEVGSQHNRKVYRVMKVYKHTIHTINIKEPLTVRIIKHFEATYSQEIYDLKIINKQEGDSLFLAIIEERINLFIELKKEFNIIKEEMPPMDGIKTKKNN